MSLQHWERYYRTGSLASCPLGPRGDYTQEVRQVWEEFFSALPAGARILDVGTGNGAVALIARETADALGRRFEIHGTDLAQIDPVRNVPDGQRLFAGIRFHPQVGTEELPFAAGHFDAVSGQYALEYTDVARSLREIRRVLKPGGQALFILHHRDSVIAGKGRDALAQAALVLDETRVFRKLRSYLKDGPHTQAAARRARLDLGAAVDTLRDAARRADDPLTLDVTIDAIGKLLDARGHLSPGALEIEIDGVEGNVRASVRRLQDLIRFALTEAQAREIAALARAEGLEVSELELQYHTGDRLVGWRMRLARP